MSLSSQIEVNLRKASSIRALQIGMWWKTERAGGLDSVYANLIEQLPDYGVGVSGLVRGPNNVAALTNGKVVPMMPNQGGFIKRLTYFRTTIREQMAAFDPHVVGSHFALYAAMAGRAIRERPLVMHFHGPWSDEAALEGANSATVTIKRMLEGRIYRRADRVIVLSEAYGRLITERFGVAEDRVRHVPGHVDVNRFDIPMSVADARLALGWSSDCFILLAVRRLTPRMGLDRLITAMRSVIKIEPNARLYIAGKGPTEHLLMAQVQAQGLERNVQFIGYVPDDLLPLVYRAADINVVPSQALEGFGLVAVEALAAGTPSIVTPVGGLPEVVVNLSPNLVFETSSSHDMAEHLISIITGRIRLPDSATCRSYASLHFGSETAAKRTASVYHELNVGS